MRSLERMFESLGLSDEEERVYRALLAHPRRAVTQIAGDADMGEAKVRAALALLEEKGFVSRSPSRIPLYHPAPPDAAVEVLVLRRQEEIERARLAAQRLAQEFRATLQSEGPLELVEVVTGAEGIRQRFNQLQMGARREVAAFDKPPYVEVQENPSELQALKRGVRYRIVYERSVFEQPEMIGRFEMFVKAGEEARTFPELPMKLDIFDGSVALMPLNLENPVQPGALVVRSASIVSALHMLFEGIWARAVPVSALGGTESAPPSTEELIEQDRRLLVLLAAGLKDEAVARQLGQDSRTVRRRLRRLMEELGASTRFQAGLQAGRRGWL